MKLFKTIPALAFLLFLISTACARSSSFITAMAVAKGGQGEQTQSPATAVQRFNSVEGADLASRLDAAAKRGRGGQTPYWSAYSFEVRSGVAVDPVLHEFHGSMNTSGDTSVFVGTTASGVSVETRNLAIFLLRDGGGTQVTRMEVYNLERKREYANYPVYWLGQANNEESLNYLRGIADSSPLTMLGERAVLAIALHDDARVAGMLKNFVRTSQNQRIRSSSIYWLGQVGGEIPFLADIVRNETEDKKFRRQAAHAIGESRDRIALNALQTLYETIKDAEVRRSIIQAVGNNQDRDQALAFLLKVAHNELDRDARRAAVRELGEFDTDNVVDELMKIYSSESEIDVKRAVLQALAETRSPRGQVRLLEIARTDPNVDLRRHAVHRLAEKGETVVDDLIKLYDSERVLEVRRAILQSLSETKSSRVEDKLFEVARSDTNIELQRQAIRSLGERAGKRSLEFLSATAQTPDGNTEVQIQAVRAISERKADESVPLLIKIARTHPNQLVRKQAIRSLGESGDPRAVEFFREVLTTK